jgi:hypothetical protein
VPSSSLDALVDDAARSLHEAAGGAAVCTFTKAGVPVPGIKYAEGRWAALREVQRATRSAPAAATSADLAATALVTWQAALDRVLSTGGGADWLAYRHGGVDALTDLLATA